MKKLKLNIGSFNVRGLNSNLRKEHLENYMKMYNSDISVGWGKLSGMVFFSIGIADVSVFYKWYVNPNIFGWITQ